MSGGKDGHRPIVHRLRQSPRATPTGLRAHSAPQPHPTEGSEGSGRQAGKPPPGRSRGGQVAHRRSTLDPRQDGHAALGRWSEVPPTNLRKQFFWHFGSGDLIPQEPVGCVGLHLPNERSDPAPTRHIGPRNTQRRTKRAEPNLLNLRTASKKTPPAHGMLEAAPEDRSRRTTEPVAAGRAAGFDPGARPPIVHPPLPSDRPRRRAGRALWWDTPGRNGQMTEPVAARQAPGPP